MRRPLLKVGDFVKIKREKGGFRPEIYIVQDIKIPLDDMEKTGGTRYSSEGYASVKIKRKGCIPIKCRRSSLWRIPTKNNPHKYD